MRAQHNHGNRSERFSAACNACEAEDDDRVEEIPETLRVPYSWRDDDQQKEIDLLDAIIAECQQDPGDILF